MLTRRLSQASTRLLQQVRTTTITTTTATFSSSSSSSITNPLQTTDSSTMGDYYRNPSSRRNDDRQSDYHRPLRDDAFFEAPRSSRPSRQRSLQDDGFFEVPRSPKPSQRRPLQDDAFFEVPRPSQHRRFDDEYNEPARRSIPRQSPPRDDAPRYSHSPNAEFDQPKKTSRANRNQKRRIVTRVEKRKVPFSNAQREGSLYRAQRIAEELINSPADPIMTAAERPTWYGDSSQAPYVHPSTSTRPFAGPFSIPHTPMRSDAPLGFWTTPQSTHHVYSTPSARHFGTTSTPSARPFTQNRGKKNRISPRINTGKAPTPDVKYLEKSAEASTDLQTPQRLLVVLDLNGTLMFRRKVSGGSKSSSPVLRPGIKEFMDYVFENFEVMVWTSARPDNAELMVNAAFSPEQREKLLAIWARDTLGLTVMEYNQRSQVYKKLTRVWEGPFAIPAAGDGQQWDQTNTVLFDDTDEKAKAHPHNLVCVPEFDGSESMCRKDCVLDQCITYLETLKFQSNASAYMRAAPFKTWK